MPDPTTWNSRATASHDDSQAVEFEDVDLTAGLSLLRTGDNLLAIHGLNRDQRGTDFLISVELHAARPQAIDSTAGRYFADPSSGGPNGLVSYSGVVADVGLSVERGFYEQPFDVSLSTATLASMLVYTTDGSPPSLTNGIQGPRPHGPASVLYPGVSLARRPYVFAPFEETSFHPRRSPTAIISGRYPEPELQSALDAGFPETWRGVQPDYGMDPDVIGPQDKYQGEFAGQGFESLRSVPSISIVMEMDDLFGETAGIYTNSTQSGTDWERATSVELIDPARRGRISDRRGDPHSGRQRTQPE